MRKMREVLRLKYECGLGHRAIAASCAISKGSVSDYLTRAREAGMTWEQAKALDDGEVERLLFRNVGRNEPSARAPIDLARVHEELRRKGVTLQLLWLEYQEAVTKSGAGGPYQHSQFCDLYAGIRARLEPSMRQSNTNPFQVRLERPEVVFVVEDRCLLKATFLDEVIEELARSTIERWARPPCPGTRGEPRHHKAQHLADRVSRFARDLVPRLLRLASEALPGALPSYCEGSCSNGKTAGCWHYQCVSGICQSSFCK